MPVTYQRLLLGVIWVITLAESIRQGWSLPTLFPGTAAEPRHSLAILTWSIVWFGLLVPSAMVPVRMLLRRIMPSRMRRSNRISMWVDRRWGIGTMSRIMTGLQPQSLMICATFLLGISAVAACEYYEAGSLPFHLAMFCVAGGIGMAVAYVLERRLMWSQL
jgi:hypothetical protein